MSHSQKQHRATDICGIRNINFEIVMAPLVYEIANISLQKIKIRKYVQHFDQIPSMLTSLPFDVHGGKCLSPSFLCSSAGWWQHHALPHPPIQIPPGSGAHVVSNTCFLPEVNPAFWFAPLCCKFSEASPTWEAFSCSPLLVAGQGSPV